MGEYCMAMSRTDDSIAFSVALQAVLPPRARADRGPAG